MPQGLAIYRADGQAIVDHLSIGGTFVDVVSVNAGATQTFTYPEVPGGQLRIIQGRGGSHTWSTGTNGSGQATLTVTAHAANGSLAYGSIIIVLARSTTEPTFGIAVDNGFGRAVSAIFPQPEFVGIATINATPGGYYTTPEGYTAVTHQVTIPGSGERLLYAVLPSSTADTWYRLNTITPSVGKDQPTQYVKAGAALYDSFVTVYTKAATYQLPMVLTFRHGNTTASSNTHGLRIWDAASNVTFDSGRDHINYTRIANDLAYPDVTGSVNSHAGLGATPAIAVPNFLRQVITLVSGSTYRRRWFIATVRRNGTNLESRLIEDSDANTTTVGSVAGTYDSGGRTALTLAECEYSRYSSFATATVTTPSAPSGALQAFPNAVISGEDAATMTLATNGARTVFVSGETINVNDWYAPQTAGIGSSYWVRATRISGNTANWTGTLDTWLAISTARTFGYTGVAVSRSGYYRFEFSTSATGTPIVSTSDNVRFVAAFVA